MKRRHFLSAAAAGATAAVPTLPFAGEKSNLKITSVRLVHTMPKRPLPAYKPSATAWSTNGVEVANPLNVLKRAVQQRHKLSPADRLLWVVFSRIAGRPGVSCEVR